MLVNPPAHLFGTANAVLSARAMRHFSPAFAGPLSLKCVIDGSATWETAQGRYQLVPGSVLLLHDGEEYSVTVDALKPVETFCLFFARGYVEDAYRVTVSSSDALLDHPGGAPVALGRRQLFDTTLLTRIHARMRSGLPLDESFAEAALSLAHVQRDVDARIARLPALRASTRIELARRVAVATSFLHANLDRNVPIEDAAREAALSPFHFQRLFKALHGVTPHRYLTRLRLERARALLRASGAPVLDVATACGFASLGSFTTLFARTFGVPPAQFRRIRETA
ncbi:MAG TPA: AraC family transcriptional regulator [Thermoanaerobaculia bacterium]|nr:AraC family transcriptional regulator [Thermoanaerobaculia bacterium]